MVAHPFLPLLPQLREPVGRGGDHGEHQLGCDLDRRALAAALNEAAAEALVDLDVEADRVLLQSDPVATLAATALLSAPGAAPTSASSAAPWTPDAPEVPLAPVNAPKALNQSSSVRHSAGPRRSSSRSKASENMSARPTMWSSSMWLTMIILKTSGLSRSAISS